MGPETQKGVGEVGFTLSFDHFGDSETLKIVCNHDKLGPGP